MTAHSAAAESYRGIGVDDDFLDFVFNNNNSTSSIIISRVVADDDGGFLRNNVKNTNMIVITPTSQVKPTIVDVVATPGAASTVTKAQSHQAIIDELHLTSSSRPRRPPPPRNDNASTPKRCNITKKKHVIEQFFSSTFSLTDSSKDDSHKSHLDDDGDDSYKSHLHDDDDDGDHDNDDDDESIVNEDSIGDVSITWSFSDIQSDGDNGSNSNNNNNNVINVNYKYDGDDEDTTSIGGVVTIEDIILGNAAFDKEYAVQDDDAAKVADKNELFDQLYDADDDDDDDTSKWSLSAVGGNNDDRDEFIESVRVRLSMVEI